MKYPFFKYTTGRYSEQPPEQPAHTSRMFLDGKMGVKIFLMFILAENTESVNITKTRHVMYTGKCTRLYILLSSIVIIKAWPLCFYENRDTRTFCISSLRYMKLKRLDNDIKTKHFKNLYKIMKLKENEEKSATLRYRTRVHK